MSINTSITNEPGSTKQGTQAKRNTWRAAKEAEQAAIRQAQYNEILGEPGITDAQIRQARIGRNDEPFAATAERLGVTIRQVHEAMRVVSLTPAERDSIVYGFLQGEHTRDAVIRTGTCATAVLGCVRLALIHARVEAKLYMPDQFETEFKSLTLRKSTSLFEEWCRERYEQRGALA